METVPKGRAWVEMVAGVGWRKRGTVVDLIVPFFQNLKPLLGTHPDEEIIIIIIPFCWNNHNNHPNKMLEGVACDTLLQKLWELLLNPLLYLSISKIRDAPMLYYSGLWIKQLYRLKMEKWHEQETNDYCEATEIWGVIYYCNLIWLSWWHKKWYPKWNAALTNKQTEENIGLRGSDSRWWGNY